MKTVGKAIGHAVLLLVLGPAIGLGVNQVRGKDRIDICHDYFRDSDLPPPGELQIVTFDEVAEISNDTAALAECRYVIIDAREKEKDFSAGHIPGALHCDHYRVDACIAAVLNVAMNAEKVVVYCTGVDCDDALFMCRDLVGYGVERFRILLYKGGWDEWHPKGMPSETSEGK